MRLFHQCKCYEEEILLRGTVLNDKITWDRFSYCAEGFHGRCDLHQNQHFGTGPVEKQMGLWSKGVFQDNSIFWQMNAKIQMSCTKHWREWVGGSKKDFKYVKGRVFAAEPVLRDEGRWRTSSSMKNPFVCGWLWMIGSAAHLILRWALQLTGSSRNMQVSHCSTLWIKKEKRKRARKHLPAVSAGEFPQT